MKKAVILYLTLLSVHYSFSQKNIDGLIQAEKNFAAHSVANSMKEAFLKYLDSTGIIFDKGKPVNGIQSWMAREKTNGVLDWQPQFAEISISNDFGYTTGPWTFRQSHNDTIVARGQYTTIWRLDKNGEWRFLVDLGVNYTGINSSREVKKIEAFKKTSKTLAISRVYPLISAENYFVKRLAKNKKKAYQQYLSAESILNHTGHLPAYTAEEKKAVIASTPFPVQYTIDGWSVSGEEDIGFVYGRAVVNGKTENYMRICDTKKQGGRLRWKCSGNNKCQ